MKLQQDFRADFETITSALTNPGHLPFAFSRYADGEYAIIHNQLHNAASDGWRWDPVTTNPSNPLPHRLHAALRVNLPEYYVGISCQPHHPDAHQWYVDSLRRTSNHHITFASLFIFSNYSSFQKLFWDRLSDFHIVARNDYPPDVVDFHVPKRPTNPEWPRIADQIVETLTEHATKPILLCAGPWSSVIISRYWHYTNNFPQYTRQTIIDIGSALDEKLRGRKSRTYHHPNNFKSAWTPTWKLPQPVTAP